VFEYNFRVKYFWKDVEQVTAMFLLKRTSVVGLCVLLLVAGKFSIQQISERFPESTYVNLISTRMLGWLLIGTSGEKKLEDMSPEEKVDFYKVKYEAEQTANKDLRADIDGYKEQMIV